MRYLIVLLLAGCVAVPPIQKQEEAGEFDMSIQSFLREQQVKNESKYGGESWWNDYLNAWQLGAGGLARWMNAAPSRYRDWDPTDANFVGQRLSFLQDVESGGSGLFGINELRPVAETAADIAPYAIAGSALYGGGAALMGSGAAGSAAAGGTAAAGGGGAAAAGGGGAALGGGSALGSLGATGGVFGGAATGAGLATGVSPGLVGGAAGLGALGGSTFGNAATGAGIAGATPVAAPVSPTASGAGDMFGSGAVYDTGAAALTAPAATSALPAFLTNPQVLGTAAGALLGSGVLGGGGQAGTVQTEEGLPDWLLPYAKQNLDRYTTELQNYQVDPYGVMPSAMKEFQNTISGMYLDPAQNKYLEDYFRLGSERIRSNLSPSFGHMQAFGQHSGYNEALSRGLGDFATGLYGGNYAKERDRQTQMTAAAPSFLGQASTAQFAPYQQYLSTIGNLGKKKEQPYFDNPMANILGGGALGYGLGQLFQPKKS